MSRKHSNRRSIRQNSRQRTTLTAALAAAMAVLVMACPLTGCSSQSSKTAAEQTEAAALKEEDQEPQTQEAKPAGVSEETLTIAIESNIGGLDPKTTVDRYSANIYGTIYETLLAYDENDNLTANSIVDSYSQTDDVTYHFKLTPGIKFHNGEELKASDVKFSLERGIGTSMNYLVGEIDRVDVVGDYEFDIVLKASNGAFLAGLTTPQTGILNEKAVTEAGDSYQLHPIGTGPYQFVSWEQGVKAIVERNEAYHGEAPYYKTLVFYEIADSTTRANQLEVKEVDVAPLAATDISRFESNSEYQMMKADTYGLIYIGMNYNSEKLADQKVRDAIAYAVDTEAIANAAYLGYAEVATAILNPNVTYSIADETPVNTFDPEQSKALLNEAGYGEGQLQLTLVIDTRTDVTQVGTMLKEYLNQAGIEAEIVTGDKTSMSGSYYAEGTNYDIFVGTWYCATPDANSQIMTTFHSSCNGATGGYCWMNRPEMDEKIEQAARSIDSSERAELYREIQETVQEEKWWIPVLYYVDNWGVSQGIDISDCLVPTGAHQWWKAK